ncbi:MAG: bifunctional UDP-N-acetylglucosamine diphosphorylase/glucosamine-1-phosphate N-acetyltransferase GlmU [Micromonosporaceae bacterium]|nr:bifunctional UDP-N-acetylglucosamine diphosphorylase/glucosamine-1-phosphate N-acetyltransferase GlmU [Micromonosporaceae bacterium]
MKSATPKVLHRLLGRTLLGHVLAAAEPLAAQRTLVVVGRGADQVTAHLAEIAPAADTVTQAEQFGTGHAVRIALAAAPELTGTLVVLNADVPLLRLETLDALVRAHEQTGAAATVLTAEVADPHGLGRITHDAEGNLAAIVEHRDAMPEQRAIREINAGVYAFDTALLRDALEKLSTDNDQGEQYLTDVFGLLRADGRRIGAHRASDEIEALGCNDRAELARLRRLLQQRINTAWMREGVTMDDPDTTWVDVSVWLARDVRLRPNTALEGATSVAEGAEIGPDTTLIDTAVGERATVLRAHSVQAEIGPECVIGPYAYLRPGTRLARKVKIGAYVETKQADIGEGSKVPHLTYVGDATIGEGTNIGAANVFVNYDGVTKHHTVVGSHVRTGSDTMLVAPVEVGDGAYTAAGSVITQDVPPGALGVARGKQRNIEGWVERRREGTASAEAARRAKSDKDHPDVRAGGDSGDTETAPGGNAG